MWVITESHVVFPWNLLSSGEIRLVERIFFNCISCCYLFGIHYLKPSTMGLCHLLVSWYVIQSAILAEMCSSLLEVKRDIWLDALFTDI